MIKHRRKNNFFKVKILEHIERNSRYYLILIILFFIGVSLGVIFLNNLSDNGKIEVSNYLNMFLEQIGTKDSINVKTLIYDSIKQNYMMILLIFFLGTTIIGAPLIYVLIFYKGFSFSYTISAIIGTLGFRNGIIICIATLIPYLIYFPTLISACVSNLVLNKEIINNKRREGLKVILTRHFLASLIAIFLIVISTIIQNYTWLLIKPIILNF